MRTRLMYHAACKVEFQPFKRLYSQLTFFNFFIKKVAATMSRSLRGHENCGRVATLLLHCSESTPRVHRRVLRFWIDGVAGVVAELRNVVQKNYRGRGASSRGCSKNRLLFFCCCGRCKTGANPFTIFLFVDTRSYVLFSTSE